MLIGLLDASVQSLTRRPLAPEEDDWAQQELLPPLLPVNYHQRLPVSAPAKGMLSVEAGLLDWVDGWARGPGSGAHGLHTTVVP